MSERGCWCKALECCGHISHPTNAPEQCTCCVDAAEKVRDTVLEALRMVGAMTMTFDDFPVDELQRMSKIIGASLARDLTRAKLAEIIAPKGEE